MNSLQNQILRTEPTGEKKSEKRGERQNEKLKKRQQQEEILEQQRISRMKLIVTPTPKIQVAIAEHPQAP